MNQYGALARQHWKRWRPASYAAITDPTAYFTDLGEEAAGEITRLWAQMRAQAGNEDYLARVARLNALRKQAEEVVLAYDFTARHRCGFWEYSPHQGREGPLILAASWFQP